MDKVSIILSKSDNFYLDDFVFVVADMWAGGYIGSLIENLVDSGGSWVDETEQDIGVKMVALVAHDQTDSMRNLDGSSIPGCMFGVWIVVGSGVCCIHIFWVHLSLVDRTLFKQVVKNMAVGTTRVCLLYTSPSPRDS